LSTDCEQSVKNFPACIGPEGSPSPLKKPVTNHSPSHVKPVYIFRPPLRSILVLSSHLRLIFPQRTLRSTQQKMCMYFLFPLPYVMLEWMSREL